MKLLRISLCVLSLGCCLCPLLAGPARADEAADEQGFVPLFDGKTTQGWRGYRQKTAPEGWVVENGVLARKGHAGDLITVAKFGDFELRLEWKISPGGNSGVIYRVAESEPASYMTGPEYQVLDDKLNHDGKNPKTSAASLYGLYAPQGGELKPVGEFNSARIIVKGNHVEHWLNGRKVVECELGSDDWKQRVAASKFAAWKNFAKMPEGHIALQDHGDDVWFRNIRIKKLSAE